MSLIKRLTKNNMKRWGGWITQDERLEFLLNEIDRLEGRIETLEDSNKWLSEKLQEMPKKTAYELEDKVFVKKITPELVSWYLDKETE